MSEIRCDLNGESIVLKCTIRAVKEITATFGSYTEAFARLGAFDHSAYVAIVAAGTGKKRAEVEDDVFAQGVDKLIAPLSDYIGLLTRGGRPETSEDSSGKE